MEPHTPTSGTAIMRYTQIQCRKNHMPSDFLPHLLLFSLHPIFSNRFVFGCICFMTKLRLANFKCPMSFSPFFSQSRLYICLGPLHIRLINFLFRFFDSVLVKQSCYGSIFSHVCPIAMLIITPHGLYSLQHYNPCSFLCPE